MSMQVESSVNEMGISKKDMNIEENENIKKSKSKSKLKIIKLHRQRALPQFECINCKVETSNDCNVCLNCPPPENCSTKNAHKKEEEHEHEHFEEFSDDEKYDSM